VSALDSDIYVAVLSMRKHMAQNGVFDSQADGEKNTLYNKTKAVASCNKILKRMYNDFLKATKKKLHKDIRTILTDKVGADTYSQQLRKEGFRMDTVDISTTPNPNDKLYVVDYRHRKLTFQTQDKYKVVEYDNDEQKDKTVTVQNFTQHVQADGSTKQKFSLKSEVVKLKNSFLDNPKKEEHLVKLENTIKTINGNMETAMKDSKNAVNHNRELRANALQNKEEVDDNALENTKILPAEPEGYLVKWYATNHSTYSMVSCQPQNPDPEADWDTIVVLKMQEHWIAWVYNSNHHFKNEGLYLVLSNSNQLAYGTTEKGVHRIVYKYNELGFGVKIYIDVSGKVKILYPLSNDQRYPRKVKKNMKAVPEQTETSEPEEKPIEEIEEDTEYEEKITEEENTEKNGRKKAEHDEKKMIHDNENALNDIYHKVQKAAFWELHARERPYELLSALHEHHRTNDEDHSPCFTRIMTPKCASMSEIGVRLIEGNNSALIVGISPLSCGDNVWKKVQVQCHLEGIKKASDLSEQVNNELHKIGATCQDDDNAKKLYNMDSHKISCHMQHYTIYEPVDPQITQFRAMTNLGPAYDSPKQYTHSFNRKLENFQDILAALLGEESFKEQMKKGFTKHYQYILNSIANKKTPDGNKIIFKLNQFIPPKVQNLLKAQNILYANLKLDTNEWLIYVGEKELFKPKDFGWDLAACQIYTPQLRARILKKVKDSFLQNFKRYNILLFNYTKREALRIKIAQLFDNNDAKEPAIIFSNIPQRHRQKAEKDIKQPVLLKYLALSCCNTTTFKNTKFQVQYDTFKNSFITGRLIYLINEKCNQMVIPQKDPPTNSSDDKGNRRPTYLEKAKMPPQKQARDEHRNKASSQAQGSPVQHLIPDSPVDETLPPYLLLLFNTPKMKTKYFRNAHRG